MLPGSSGPQRRVQGPAWAALSQVYPTPPKRPFQKQNLRDIHILPIGGSSPGQEQRRPCPGAGREQAQRSPRPHGSRGARP